MILAKVWDSKNFVDENTLNVNIARIRKKLEEVGFLMLWRLLGDMGTDL